MDSIIDDLYQAYLENPVVITDSRMVKPGCIFFALKGENFNGNDFAAEAIGNGAKLAVVDELKGVPDKRIIKVNSVLESLQHLASVHRKHLDVKIIALTGTNGKTTTKELISRVLSKKFEVLSTKGNLNNHIGVPLTVLSFTKGLDFGVVEMGANHIGEIAELCTIAQPDFGLITNIGKAHLEGFGSLHGVLKAKSELYDYLRKKKGMIFLNAENELLLKASEGLRSFTYGLNPAANCRGKILSNSPYLLIECRWGGDEITTMKTNLIGTYNFENVMAAAAVGNYFDIPVDSIQEAIESFIPENNRSQIIKTPNNTVILDAYNANPSSMKAAIENFADGSFENKVLILGDMFELGRQSETEHRNILQLIGNRDFNRIFLIGSYFQKVNESTHYQSFTSTASMLDYLKNKPLSGNAILVKGSRKMELERLLPYL
jgi:UDP-N-acetylmuramoyl-tripeptide--D-alanyl-D-alanine ligase